MYLIRPARLEDLDQLFQLIQKSEEGMTSLKLTKEGLLDRIESSIFSFERTVHKVSGLPYVFVLTEPENGNIIGTCSIYSKVGGFDLFTRIELKNRFINPTNLMFTKKSIRSISTANTTGQPKSAACFLIRNTGERN